MSLRRIYGPIALSSEKNLVEILKKKYEYYGFATKTEFPLHFGSIDIVVWNGQEILLFEVKHKAGFNEIAHALGQILIYREQMKNDGRELKGIVHTRCATISKEEHDFLKKVLAKYNVELEATSIGEG